MDGVANSFEQTPHLPVPTFLKNDDQPEAPIFDLTLRLDGKHLRQPIFQLDPVDQPLKGLPGWASFHIHPIDLRRAIPGMKKPVGAVAVVGEEEETGAVPVEPPDMEEMVQLRGKQVVDRLPAARIVAGRDVSTRLVQHDPLGGQQPDALPVDADGIPLRIHLRADLRPSSIDRHPSLEDELFGPPP